MPLINLTFGWGDQTVTDVGSETEGLISHVYASAGAYMLTATAKDATGGTATLASGPLMVK